MRRTVLGTAATLAILAVVSLVPNCAEAITVTTPANIQAVVNDANLVQDVALTITAVPITTAVLIMDGATGGEFKLRWAEHGLAQQ